VVRQQQDILVFQGANNDYLSIGAGFLGVYV